MFTFWVVLWLIKVGMDDSPSPCGKNSHFIPFSLIFFLQNEHSGAQNKIYLKWSNWSDNTSPYCKTCFSTSEWFWHAKNHLVKLQRKWDLGRPQPPCFFLSKFPHFPICFGECPFNKHSCDKTSKIHLWSSGHLMLDLGLEEYILEYLECGGHVRKRRIRHFRCHFPQFERAAVV